MARLPLPTPLTTNLLAYYKLDETSGAPVADSSGNAIDGTWEGTLGSQWTTGKINNGGLFNGTDNYIDLGTPASLRFTGATPFSFAGWIKRSNTNEAAFDFFGNINPNNPFNGYDFGISGDVDHFQALQLIMTDGSLNQVNVVSNGLVDDTDWHHVVVTYNGNSNASGVIFYIDSVAQTNTILTNTLSGSISSTNPLSIGSRVGATGSLFPGMIDEFGVWGKVLSQSEVTQLYASGGGLQYPFAGMPRTVAGARTAIGNRVIVRDFGTCLNFDGNDDRVIVSSPIVTQNSAKTVSMWFKTNTVTTAQTMTSFSTGTSGRGGFSIQATGKLRADSVGTASGRRFDTDLILRPDTWYFAAYTHALLNGASVPAGAISVYINGALQSVAETTPGGAAGESTEFAIGIAGSGQLVNDFSGRIDDIRIWDSVLTAQQILDLYYAGSNPSTPLYWYKFDEGSGATATDSGTGAINGVITGATYSSDVVTIPRTNV